MRRSISARLRQYGVTSTIRADMTLAERIYYRQCIMWFVGLEHLA